MTGMLKKALWDTRWSTFWFAFGGAVYVLAIALFYPNVREQAATFDKLLATYPKPLLTLFGYTDMTTFSGFMSIETMTVILPAVFLIFATLTGSGLIAKEIEDGTSELWLSVPDHRWRLFLAKMAALAIALIAMVASVVAATWLGAALVNVTVEPRALWALLLTMAAFLLTVGAYSSLFSAISSSRGRAAGISLAVTLVSYLLWVVASLAHSWQWLKDFSIFTAYAPQAALANGHLDAAPIAILAGITAICVAFSLVAFERRDAIA